MRFFRDPDHLRSWCPSSPAASTPMLLHAAFSPDQQGTSARLNESPKCFAERPAINCGNTLRLRAPFRLTQGPQTRRQQAPHTTANVHLPDCWSITGRCSRNLHGIQLPFHCPERRQARIVHAWLGLHGLTASEGRRAPILAHSAVSERTAFSAASCVRPSMNVTYGLPSRCNSTRYPAADSATRNSSCDMPILQSALVRYSAPGPFGGGRRNNEALLRRASDGKNVQQLGGSLHAANRRTTRSITS